VVNGCLRRKLLRDMRRTAGQFAAVCAVVLCATAVFVGMRGAYDSLVLSREAFYDRYHFADFFVELEKAPVTALRDLEAIPGVARVRGRIVKDVPLDVEGGDGTAVARFISMPDRRDGLINDIHMVSGSYFPGAHEREVILNDSFCEANHLQIGGTVRATINERKETFTIVGTAYSPEYVYAIRTPQQFAPDDRNFAIVFARKSFVEDAFNMTGAVNEVVGLLRPGARVDAVLDAAKKRLKSYGVYAKYGRKDQLSHHYLDNEIRGLWVSALVLPVIFLAVAALVIHVLMRRMTELQRTQIGLLCALGYRKWRIVLHYVSYALAVAVGGSVPGIVIGYILACQMTRMYNQFFHFPSLRLDFAPQVCAAAFLLNAAMCCLGAVRSAGRVLRIHPAIAIRPQAPSAARTVQRGALHALWERLPLVWRITVRSATRAWSRSVFTIAGVAVSVVILLVGTGMMDWVYFIMDHQFRLVDQADVHVDFATEEPTAAVRELDAMPGCQRAEGVLQFGAELHSGWRKKTILVMGLPADSRLYKVRDRTGRRVALPADGLVIPERAARALGLTAGSMATLDPYLRDKDERPVRIQGVTDQYLGLTSYARRDFLERWLNEGPVVNGALLAAEGGARDSLARVVDDLPGVQSVTATGTILGGFEDTFAAMMNVTVVILTLFAGVIAFAVIYNASSVSIAEQERDLACMASLGYEREDIAQAATGDIMPLGVIGIAAGLPLGVWLCYWIAKLYESDLYKVPVVIRTTTYLRVILFVLVFQLVARWACRRRVRRIDIVRRLKTME
jgi:putative ABC transport system permease protein